MKPYHSDHCFCNVFKECCEVTLVSLNHLQGLYYDCDHCNYKLTLEPDLNQHILNHPQWFLYMPSEIYPICKTMSQSLMRIHKGEVLKMWKIIYKEISLQQSWNDTHCGKSSKLESFQLPLFSLPAIDKFMHLHNASLSEGFNTVLAEKWPLPTMHQSIHPSWISSCLFKSPVRVYGLQQVLQTYGLMPIWIN